MLTYIYLTYMYLTYVYYILTYMYLSSARCDSISFNLEYQLEGSQV